MSISSHDSFPTALLSSLLDPDFLWSKEICVGLQHIEIAELCTRRRAAVLIRTRDHGFLASSDPLTSLPYRSYPQTWLHQTLNCLHSDPFVCSKEDPPTRSPPFCWCLLRYLGRASQLGFWSRRCRCSRQKLSPLADSSSLSICSHSELRTQLARSHSRCFLFFAHRACNQDHFQYFRCRSSSLWLSLHRRQTFAPSSRQL